MHLPDTSPSPGPITPAPNDVVADLVAAALHAVQGGDQAAITAAVEVLAPLNTGDVLAELCLCVEEATAGVHVANLVRSARLPLPPRPIQLIDAVAARDLPAILVSTSRERPEAVFAALLVLAASLREARARQQGRPQGHPVPDAT